MAVANIVLNTKTYAFSSDQGGIITLLDQSGGIPNGFSELTISLTPPQKGGAVYRAKFGLGLPVVALVDSSCSCVGAIQRFERGSMTFDIPVNGTLAERTDFALRAKDLLANVQIQALLASLTRPG